MLIGRYSVLTKSPGRFFGGSTVSDARSNWGNTGSARGRYYGTEDQAFGEKNATPTGYVPPYSLYIAQVSGGLSSYQFVSGSGTTNAATLQGGRNAVGSGDGVGTLTPSGTMGAPRTAAPAGVGTLAGDITAITGTTSTLDGVGDFASDGTLGGPLGASPSGTSSISTADLLGSIYGELLAEGVGSLTCEGLLTLPAEGSVDGTSSITAEILGGGVIVAAPAGDGAWTTADLEAHGNVLASPAGTGSLTGSMAETLGNMEAEIVVTYTATVDAAELATLIWDKVLEGSYTAADLQRIIAGVAAGKSSGGPGSPVFRSLDDTVDRVSGIADSDGNRTAVTYNPG